MITKKPVETFTDMSRSDFRKVFDADLYTVELVCGVYDKYGRTLSKMYFEGNDNSIGRMLVDEGMAVEYNGGTKMPEPTMIQNLQKRRDERCGMLVSS
jgi:endonuclease YncB( thermonuclease family)